MAKAAQLLEKLEKEQLRKDLPEFKSGDTVKVYAKISEGGKERVQVFEGIVIKRHKKNVASATFTVRKISYNVGVERTFLLHSPRIEKIEVVATGKVRRSRLFYLRPLRGKASKIRSVLTVGEMNTSESAVAETAAAPAEQAQG